MSNQERSKGRPPQATDYSLPSLGEQTDEFGRPLQPSARRRGKAFDPTQYVQGQPTQAEPAPRRRYEAVAEPVQEDLPPPSYQPHRQAAVEPETQSVPPVTPPRERVFPRTTQAHVPPDAEFASVPSPEVAPQTETPQPRNIGMIVNFLGAATSIALVFGLGYWGYKLAVRDVSGIPVVAALEGPMRIQPKDPGGQLAMHQGLAVNAVQAVGEAEATADRLVLAPEPVDLLEDDPVVEVATQEPSAKEDQPEPAPAPEPDPQPIEEPQQIALTTEPEIEAPEALDVPAAIEAATAENPDIIPASIGGVAKSARPRQRPSGFEDVVSAQQESVAAALAMALAGDADPAAVADDTASLAPSNLAVGTNLAQLGAYASEDIARAEWVKKTSLYGDYMEGKTRVIERAERGGRTFYRLRAHGFETINEARQFCAALQAEGAECVSVVVR
ncbi:SPOR domain-containing protein [Falsihalocynthiibacter sp. SS001]|uniref:SPOR domain-containing protein n=1 Tax=Falsihalocynthiibacter sp. SS001 TaxID=3349698 RepID=UPI0036D3495F